VKKPGEKWIGLSQYARFWFEIFGSGLLLKSGFWSSFCFFLKDENKLCLEQ